MNKIISRISYLASGLILFTMLNSCGSDEDPKQEKPHEEKKDEVVNDRTEKIENIFFNIPSPLETINILQQAGASYEWNLPLDPKLVDSYSSSTEQAIAMGVYSADLNYASVFNQSNDMYLFLACAERLGETLGVGQVFTKEVTDRIEYNIENKDSMQIIISETFWELDANLHEAGRETVSALIICGGWLEGVHLATQLLVLNPGNTEIKTRIAEQKYSINNLIMLLDSYSGNASLEDITNSYKELGALFAQIEEEKVDSKNKVDEDGLPIIGKQINLVMSDELLKEITRLISEIRVEYTQ